MSKFLIIYILANFIFVNLPLCALAQSKLSGSLDKPYIIMAQLSAKESSVNERAFWDSVKDSKTPDEYRAYLEQYPKGVFAPLARARLKSLESTTVIPQSGATTDTSKITSAKEIKRDGLFVAYDNGTVLDTKTNLMWAAKDNGADIKWNNAQDYCYKYKGGNYTDWRVPTASELKELYDTEKSYPSEIHGLFGSAWDIHITELIRLSSYEVWTSETDPPGFRFTDPRDGPYAKIIDFNNGKINYIPQFWDKRKRALPVRQAR